MPKTLDMADCLSRQRRYDKILSMRIKKKTYLDIQKFCRKKEISLSELTRFLYEAVLDGRIKIGKEEV